MKFLITEETHPYNGKTVFNIERFDERDRLVHRFYYLCRDAVSSYAERVKSDFPESEIVFRVK